MNLTSELVEKILVTALSLVILAAMAPLTFTGVVQTTHETVRLQQARALVDELDYGITQVASGRTESFSKEIFFPDQTTVQASGFTLTVECTALGRTFTMKRAYPTPVSMINSPHPGSRTMHVERRNSTIQISLELLPCQAR